jgi:hypothetical protein
MKLPVQLTYGNKFFLKKINIKQLTLFLYNKIFKLKFLKTYHLQFQQNQETVWGNKFNKYMQDFNAEDFNTLKEIKDDLNKQANISC